MLPDDRGAELRVALLRDRDGEDARVAMSVTLGHGCDLGQHPRRRGLAVGFQAVGPGPLGAAYDAVMSRTRPFVASADHGATEAGAATLRGGGNAVDAAIATNAVLAVTAPHLCGLGGDLLALVYAEDSVDCLISAGRAGSRASAAELREQGHASMPLFGDPRSVTVPGCVDGLLALHEQFGSRDLAELFAPAIMLAECGFTAESPLTESVGRLGGAAREQLNELATQATSADAVVRRPGVARVLRAIAGEGRDGFYAGEFGAGLLDVPGITITADDLTLNSAQWVAPLRASAWGVDVWVAPPPSQGYLLPASALLAASVDLPGPDDADWAHLLIECAAAAAHDRPEVLFDGADGPALIAAAAGRRELVDPDRAGLRGLGGAGDTTYLCVTDRAGMGVSLIQSNASGFGSQLAEPSTGINLHNRGLGFSLQPGHPAELTPGRRPPHTLVPALATDSAGLRAVFGTMGGDAQPQILLQVAARLFAHGEHPAAAVAAPRWALRSDSGFDTWTAAEVSVAVEADAPAGWVPGLFERGHRVADLPAKSSAVGHANAIARLADGSWAAGADPRTVIGSAG